jgi:hypothetical protein
MFNNPQKYRDSSHEEILMPLSLDRTSPVASEIGSPENTARETPLPQEASRQNDSFSSLKPTIETCLIVIGIVAIFLLLPRNTGGDGWKRYTGLLDIVIHHHIPSIKYSLIGPSFALPLVWIGHKLGDPYNLTITYNQILFAVTLLASYVLLRKRIDTALLRKFYLLLLTASMFVAHLAFFYGEVFTALLVGFGVLIAYLRFSVPAGWLLVALGVANTPATLGALVLLVAKRMLDDKRLRYLLVFCAALAFVGLDNWLQRGNPFNAAYTDDHGIKTIMPYSGLPNFSYPLFFGILSLTLSFGKGLLFFAPGLLLPVRKALLRRQTTDQIPLYQVYILWIAFTIGLILVYARWWDWSGAIFWGPRFLLFASIPASFALAVRLSYHKDAPLALNLLTLAIFVLSVWVCIDGAVYQWINGISYPAVCLQHQSNLEALCLYTPEFSALWSPFVFHYPLDKKQILFIMYVVIAACYLITPLCIQIAQQAIEPLKRYRQIYLSPTHWRF